MSENAAVIAGRASKFPRQQRQVERAKLGGQEMGQSLHRVEEWPVLLISTQVCCESLEFADVASPREWMRAKRMSVGDGDFVGERTAVCKADDYPPAESLLPRVGRVIAVGPFRVFLGADLMPQIDESGIVREFRRVTLHVVPEAGVQRGGEDVHEAMVQRFPAGLRVQLLRVAGAGADDGVGVVARVDDNLPNSIELRKLAAQAEGEINPRLGLVFGGMFLGRSEEHTSEL